MNFTRLEMTIPARPRPKPRMTQRSKWLHKNQNYWDWVECVQHYTGLSKVTLTFPVRLYASFYLPIPKTRARSCVMGSHHIQQLDLDNLIKAIKDAMFDNDGYVCEYGYCGKYWDDGRGTRAEIILENMLYDKKNV